MCFCSAQPSPISISSSFGQDAAFKQLAFYACLCYSINGLSFLTLSANEADVGKALKCFHASSSGFVFMLLITIPSLL